jgi:hypothetical protein
LIELIISKINIVRHAETGKLRYLCKYNLSQFNEKTDCQMEYFRDPKNQIQADIAYRLGIVAKQYSSASFPENENFSSTLDICILQNLLTNCVTLLDSMAKNERKASFLTSELSVKKFWGLSVDQVKVNTFRSNQLKINDVLKHIRNALSHPTSLDIDSAFPSTGYTTIPEISGKIKRFCFVSSPDVTNNRPKESQTEKQGNTFLEKAKTEGTMPLDVVLVQADIRKFIFSRNGSPFGRVFKILLSNIEIHELVMELSNYLAQPIQKDWDGNTIIRLVA